MLAEANGQAILSQISQRWGKLKERIAKIAEKSGKNPEEIKVVAVSKTFPAIYIRAAVECGLRLIGENRVQEALPKIEELRDLEKIEWHLVGHLQTNKARKAVEHFDLIQSLDSEHLAQKLDTIGKELNKKVRVLVEVNTSGEETKFGINPETAIDFIRGLEQYSNLEIKGLMTVGPLTTDIKRIRYAFSVLRGLYEQIREIQQGNLKPEWLSMGMSDDFEIAIEEGSNMLRIGRAIFGERSN